MSRASRGRPQGPGGVVRGGALGLRGAGFVVVVVRLLGAVIQHEGLGLMGDGDGAGTLGPRLPVHLHGHLGAFEHQLQRQQHPNVRWATLVDLESYNHQEQLYELFVGGLTLSFARQARNWPHMSRVQLARKKDIINQSQRQMLSIGVLDYLEQ